MDAALRSSVAQASIAAGCIVIYLIRIISPKGPQWTRLFAGEELPYDVRTKRWTFWTTSLLALSVLGLIFSTLTALFPSLDYIRLLDVAPWVAGFFLTLLDLPRKTPKTLLALYLTSLVCPLVALTAAFEATSHVHILRFAAPSVALMALFVILAMPMRDPALGSAGIAGEGDFPTSDLRSPEDNLSLWQFMTVSWLSPLISRGYRHQLNDGDVWQLPYEFQHKLLHMLFRELEGPVWLRLVLANGLDLLIVSMLGILEATANLSAPLLLRSLLLSIQKGPEYRIESVLWALAMLALRLVSTQSGVFSLWFGRRAYERSRGEMITMVYAKTLARKSYGQPVNHAQNDQKNGFEDGSENGLGNGNNGDVDADEETPLISPRTEDKSLETTCDVLEISQDQKD